MRQQGQTLIELLIASSIAAILAAIAIPSLSNQIQRHRVRAVAADLLRAIELTREHAVASNQRVTIHRAGEWSKGWEVFVDKNGDGERSGEEKLLIKQYLNIPIKIITNQPVKNYISYVGTGESKTITGAWLAGTLVVCSTENTNAYAIKIRNGGRARIDAVSDSECI